MTSTTPARICISHPHGLTSGCGGGSGGGGALIGVLDVVETTTGGAGAASVDELGRSRSGTTLVGEDMA